MSFLDDMKMFGMVVMAIGAITAVMTLISHTDDILLMVICLIPAVALLLVGYLAYSGEIKRKYDAICAYLIYYGLASAIYFAIVFGMALFDGNFNWEPLAFTIIGVFAFFVGIDLKSGKRLNVFVWMLLFVIFLLFIVRDVLAIFNINFGGDLLTALGLLAVSVLSMIMSVYLLYFTISDDVRKRFTM